MLALHSILRPSQGAAWREMSGETVVLDTRGRMMRGFNAMGGAAWKLADGTRTIAEIASALAAPMSPEVAARIEGDVLAFFHRLHALGLLEEAAS